MKNDSEWNENKFEHWIKLRESLAQAKREKQWERTISVCEEIIEFDKQAKFIEIFTPIIRKVKAKALEKLERINDAITEFKLMIIGFEQIRKAGRLNDPSDWLDEIEKGKKCCKN